MDVNATAVLYWVSVCVDAGKRRLCDWRVRVCVQLDKAYDPNAAEDDMVERYEEMNRMREHVMKEVDKDQNRLISLDEFIDSTRQADFKKDEAWDVCMSPHTAHAEAMTGPLSNLGLWKATVRSEQSLSCLF